MLQMILDEFLKDFWNIKKILRSQTIFNIVNNNNFLSISY